MKSYITFMKNRVWKTSANNALPEVRAFSKRPAERKSMAVVFKHIGHTLKFNAWMKRHFFALILLTFALYSCDNKKSYKYVEVVQEESILGGTDTKEKEPKQIKAADDSSAYIEAYQNFCISTKVNKDMQTSIGKTYSVPKSFKLFNEQGKMLN